MKYVCSPHTVECSFTGNISKLKYVCSPHTVECSFTGNINKLKYVCSPHTVECSFTGNINKLKYVCSPHTVECLEHTLHTILLEKYTTFCFCKNLVDFNEACLQEATLNLHMHA